MKRFLIALLGISLSLTLAIFHSSLKADARSTTHSMTAAVAQSTAQVVPTPKSPDLEILGTSVRYLRSCTILSKELPKEQKAERKGVVII